MRVVLDANVLIAAYAARGLCEAIVELCIANDEIFVSKRLLEDVRAKLTRKIKLPGTQVDEIVSFLVDYTARMEPAAVPDGTCRDPDDHDILGLADAARADFIITGDEDLLVLKSYQGAAIVPPRRYWEEFGKRAR